MRDDERGRGHAPAPLTRAELWWLALALALLAALKLPYSSAWTFPAGYDGGYYTNIVQNLLAGDGLTTDVSLYHRGFRDFPHHDSIHPLWPLIYAAFAWAFPLERVAVWLPTALYFTSLLAAWAWGRRVSPGDLFRRAPGFHGGHLLVVVLGLQSAYFVHTSRPFTEGLAYTLLFLFLWRAVLLLQRRSWRDGLEAGAWLGALLLVRSQFAVVVASAVLALALGLVLYAADRRRLVVFGACAALAMLLTMLPYALYLGQNADGHFSIWNYLFFGETPADSPLSQARPYLRPSGLAHLALLGRGVLVAFQWRIKTSYLGSYHLFHYALPVALAVGAWALGRGGVGPERRARALAWLRDPKNAPWLLFGVLAVLLFLSCQLLVKSHDRWYFHRRHNLVTLPLFSFALLALLRARWRLVAWVGAALFVGGTIMGVAQLGQATLKVLRTPPSPPKPELVGWLNAEQQRLGRPLIVAFNQPQVIVWQTPELSYHEVNVEISTLDDVLIMFDELGTDYLVSRVRKNVRHRADLARLQQDLELLPQVQLGGVEVYRRRRPDAPPPPPPWSATAADDDGDDD
ncbi:MAG: hypothetical protein IT383_26615 [Deltaproteobacteria bacterium]|nr:hypothetical protein [Deltaproteobacteria bacterium]